MNKNEILKIVTDAIESGAIQYTLDEWNTGDCTLTLSPISFHREIPPPPIDPEEPKYVILRGDESPATKDRIRKKHGGNVEFLPSCTEIKPFGKWYCELHINGQILQCDKRNLFQSFGEPENA